MFSNFLSSWYNWYICSCPLFWWPTNNSHKNSDVKKQTVTSPVQCCYCHVGPISIHSHVCLLDWCIKTTQPPPNSPILNRKKLHLTSACSATCPTRAISGLLKYGGRMLTAVRVCVDMRWRPWENCPRAAKSRIRTLSISTSHTSG